MWTAGFLAAAALFTPDASAGFVSSYESIDKDDVPLVTPLFGDTAYGPQPLYVSQTIGFPQLDRDGLADVCGFTGTSVLCRTHVYDGYIDNGDGTVTIDSADGLSFWTIANTELEATLFDSEWSHYEDYWGTIRYPDVDGDGLSDVCGRGHSGIECATAAEGLTDGRTWTTMFGDAGRWYAHPSHWATIQFPDIDGDGRADVCGRAWDGLYCGLSAGSSFMTAERVVPEFSNANGWSADKYWSTIQFADLDGDGDDDVCARGSAGVHGALYDHVSRRYDALTLWTGQYSDASGWGAQQYYATIQLGDINGDGAADICGRGGAGVFCGISDASGGFHFTDRMVAPYFSNSNGFDQPERYETFVLADTDGDGRDDICARGADGLYCALSESVLAPYFPGGAVLWVDNFGDNYGWGADEAYWGTVQPAHMLGERDGVEWCGRGYAGVHCSNR